MLHPLSIPGLLITGTNLGVGKTVIAGAIADWFAKRQRRVAVCKIVDTKCVRRREGLVSEDAEFLAVCARSRHPLDLICPQRYAERLAPAIAADRSARPIDWFIIDNSIRLMAQDSDVMIVEGAGGIMSPMDPKHTLIDVAIALKIPAIVVALPGAGTINHTILTVEALRHAGVSVAGVVVNRYPPDVTGLAEEAAPRAIERWGKVPVLCIVPEEPIPQIKLPPGIVSAIELVDWAYQASAPAAPADRPTRRG